jgi:hypothetical protein
MDVAFYFDPACDWTWLASRWLIEVSLKRGLRLYWSSYSRLISSGTKGLPDQQLVERVAAHRALRVVEAVRDRHPDMVGALCEALMRQSVEDRAARRPPFANLRRTLVAAGVDPRYALAAGQDRWDDAIRISMDAAHAVFGRQADVPAVVIARSRRPVGFCCPKISPMPTGAAALALWDARVARAGGRPPAAAIQE